MAYVIIDVREPAEFAASHVKGAINIPPYSLMQGAVELEGLSKDSPIIVYCRSGSRSNVALHLLKSLGYTNVVNGVNQAHVEAKLLSESS